MKEVSIQIGKRVRSFRKTKKISMESLAQIIGKSKSTVSKYENGEIVIDIETLYDIAEALDIHVEQLLWSPTPKTISANADTPGFFEGVTRFYSYVYDGRSNNLIRCVFDVLSGSEDGQYRVVMYMNFKEYAHYQKCENTYWGYMEHFDAITNIQLTNQDTPMEKVSIKILASFLPSETKWGLFCGFSSRPMMPVAVKMLFSRSRLQEDAQLIRQLKVSKDDIRLLKLYNMMAVI